MHFVNIVFLSEKTKGVLVLSVQIDNDNTAHSTE